MEDFNGFWGCFIVYDIIQLLSIASGYWEVSFSLYLKAQLIFCS